MPSLFTGARIQVTTAAGVVPGALVYTYRAGTTTPASTYTSQSLASENANPVVCDTDGQAVIWLDDLAYRFIVKTAAGVELTDDDNITAAAAFTQSGTGAVARTAQAKLREFVSPEDFGAVGNGTTDDLAAFNACLTSLANGGAIYLQQGKNYRLSAVWTFSHTLTRIRVYGNGATITADHTGHGIDCIGTNENYSRHVFQDFVLQGPNVSYPTDASSLAGTSTGAGFRLGDSTDTSNTPAAFGCEFRNVQIQGFKYGRYWRAAMECNVIGGAISFCQYGETFDGGQSNANTFLGVRYRENRRIGVTSTGTTGGSLSNVTSNRFIGCLFETNIPYRSDTGGYPALVDTSGTLGVAVYLANSYSFQFHGNYYENHNYSVVLDFSSDQNTFIGERFDGNGGVRIGGVKFIDSGAINNKFLLCDKNCTTSTEVNVESNHADHAGNQFLDCSGFNFIAGSLTGTPHVRNNQLTQAGGGMVIGDDGTAPQGVATDVQSGTGHGQIETIGSATATLHCQGFGTVVCNTAIAAAGTNTTITTIDPGVRRNFTIKILNIQATRTVTIKHNSTIKCKSGADTAIASTTGVILLWVAPSGTVYEL